MGAGQVVSRTAITVIGLLLTGVIGWFVLDTLFWLLGWKGRERPPRWEDDVRPPDHPRPTAGD